MFIKPYDLETQKKLSTASAQNYDRTKIEITKAGKTYNLYDSIQAQREDTEIYPTLEKYGNLDVMRRTPIENYEEFNTAINMQDLLMQDKHLEEIFDNLSSEDRKEFNNNFYEFKQKGLKYFTKKAQKEIEQRQKLREEEDKKRNQPIKVEVTNNETKN